MGFRLAIDASRARSGGAINHLVGLLSCAQPGSYGIDEIHIWSYPELLQKLPRRAWLVGHAPDALSKGIVQQLWWQRRHLSAEVKAAGCAMLLNVDAGTVATHRPAITISQDMLSFEPGEMQRYPLGKARIRLELLKHVQNRSLTYGEGAIFLTDYAAGMIQESSGPIGNFAVVPHGVNEMFRDIASGSRFPEKGERPVSCLYVSNADAYKHQWHVVKAIKMLRDEHHDVQITLAGGGDGAPADRLAKEIAASDPQGEFVQWLPFLSHSELVELYKRVDLIVFASSCENMPITLIEGMASGLPIACSSRGPMPEVLQDGGEYFDPEDPESIADAISTLIENPERRKKSREAAQSYAKAFTWERCASETLEFIARRYRELYPD